MLPWENLNTRLKATPGEMPRSSLRLQPHATNQGCNPTKMVHAAVFSSYGGQHSGPFLSHPSYFQVVLFAI